MQQALPVTGKGCELWYYPDATASYDHFSQQNVVILMPLSLSREGFKPFQSLLKLGCLLQ